MPGSNMAQDRKVLHIGSKVLRSRAKMVKPERVGNQKSLDVVDELVRVMHGPNLPGRGQRGGTLVATQLGVPSRLVVFEDTADDINDLSQEEKDATGRREPFGPKAIFNPRLKPTTAETAVHWEKSASFPGYRALVERPLSVQVMGLDPEGREVDYVASGWEARMALQAVDAVDGIFPTDRCIMRSLRHLDTQNEPLPPDCPPVGASGTPSEPLTKEQLDALADKGGSRGFLAGIPGIGRPNVVLAGSLLLRLPAEEVPQADLAGGRFDALVKELKEAMASGKHPLGIAGPQLGRRSRVVAIGEDAEAVEKLSARVRVTEQHRAFGTLVLFNPVLTPKGSAEAYFFERTPSVPGYEGIVGRSVEVDVRGLDEKGDAVSFTATGWQARMLQHTVDILDGVLYVDRMERRSFRRDNIADDLPEDVPYGVKTKATARKVKSKKPSTKKRQSSGLRKARLGAKPAKGIR